MLEAIPILTGMRPEGAQEKKQGLEEGSVSLILLVETRIVHTFVLFRTEVVYQAINQRSSAELGHFRQELVQFFFGEKVDRDPSAVSVLLDFDLST